MRWVPTAWPAAGADTFAPEKLLEIPPPQALPPTKMPCATYPSDHFALQVTLRFAA